MSAGEPREDASRERTVAQLRKWAGYAATENNFDGDLKPEDTFYWTAADIIEAQAIEIAAAYRRGLLRAAEIAHTAAMHHCGRWCANTVREAITREADTPTTGAE